MPVVDAVVFANGILNALAVADVVTATFVALVAVVAVVAVVADVALPDKDAVIVPAEKFPDASRATIVLAVFADAVVIAWV